MSKGAPTPIEGWYTSDNLAEFACPWEASWSGDPWGVLTEGECSDNNDNDVDNDVDECPPFTDCEDDFCLSAHPGDYATELEGTWFLEEEIYNCRPTWSHDSNDRTYIMWYDDTGPLGSANWTVSLDEAGGSNVWYESDFDSTCPWGVTWIAQGFGTVTQGACMI